MADQTGPNNPNWKGGRVVDPRGYVLIRVGVGHPLADVRGYAYEHRLVAQAALGRDLRPGEEVHHETEIKDQNSPDKLKVARSRAEHRKWHRKHDRGLRDPGEPNPLIECGCGCGTVFDKYDRQGRPRTYVSGHNSHSKRWNDGRFE